MATLSGDIAVVERQGSLEGFFREEGASGEVWIGGGVCERVGDVEGVFWAVIVGDDSVRDEVCWARVSLLGVEVDLELLRSLGFATVNFRGARKPSIFQTPDP
jgi:hypothetical protein